MQQTKILRVIPPEPKPPPSVHIWAWLAGLLFVLSITASSVAIFGKEDDTFQEGWLAAGFALLVAGGLFWIVWGTELRRLRNLRS